MSRGFMGPRGVVRVSGSDAHLAFAHFELLVHAEHHFQLLLEQAAEVADAALVVAAGIRRVLILRRRAGGAPGVRPAVLAAEGG